MKAGTFFNKNETMETCYISSGCNRTPHCMDWGKNNLICYGSRNAVNIYVSEGINGRRVLKTLSLHKDRVNSVRWIKNATNINEAELVSSSTDHSLIVWSLNEGDFIASAHLNGHTGPVNAVDAIYKKKSPTKSVILVSSSGDSSLKIWQRIGDEKQEFSCLETLSLKTGLCFCVEIFELSKTETPVLGFATDNCQIHLYLIEDQCKKLTSLSGHEDWVRAINFINSEGTMFLASSSQDTTVRLWKITESIDELDDGSFKLSKIEFEVDTIKYSICLESVLCGHEGWVYGLQWSPQSDSYPLTLMTASLDRTIILWSPDPESGVWLERARMGELGGNTLGYFGCKFSTNGEQILAHSFQGSFHMWINENGQWKPGVTVGGHFDSVVDIGWEKNGNYLLSTGLDQTTRLHAPWVFDTDGELSWHELSRPQVHGYAMNCITILPEFTFVSGAEEKVARVFKAPRNTLENLSYLANVKVDLTLLQGENSEPTGAAVPALGLSNKAVFSDKSENPERNHPSNPKDEYSETYFVPQHFKEPANEDALFQNTLWPEVMKLYGHGYEVFSLTATHKGDLIASSCKATTAQHAKIFLWDTNSWEKCDELSGHQLTITQMAFSPDDNYLLSVSRDRKWCLFERNIDSGKYNLKSTTDKATGIHSRIIWTCAWSHGGKYFATGSRDGKLVVWKLNGTNDTSVPPLNGVCPVGSYLDLKEAITALDFSPVHLISDKDIYLLAIGYESGIVKLYSWTPLGTSNWCMLFSLNNNNAHHLTVKRLQFRPKLGKTGDETDKSSNTLQLASASLDNSVKIYNINLTLLKKQFAE